MLLVILIKLDRPIRCAPLATLVGTNEETTRGYLRELAQQQLITRVKSKYWIPTVTGRQYILPTIQKDAENPRVLLPTTTITLIEGEEAVEGEVIKRRGKSACLGQKDAEIPRVSGNLSPTILEAYNEVGIGLNNRTIRLAQQPHITPDYIRGHHAILSKRGQGSETGLLIYILESGQPLPASKDDSHDRRRYFEGVFADIIKH